MDMLLLGITVVSLTVALVMSVSAWRVTREERRRAAARVAALAAAAGIEPAKAPWAPSPVRTAALVDTRAPAFGATATVVAPERPTFAPEPTRHPEPATSSLFAHQTPTSGSGGRQHVLATAAVVLFVALSAGLGWEMLGPRGTSPRAMGPNHPLELVSLRHDRQSSKLAISGLVRNPASGEPVDHLSAVVFLFDQAGAFLSSGRAPVDFVRMGAGDESPFVVTIDAPSNVARYRVSFRTDDGVMPHIDRRGAPPAETAGEQPVSVTLK